MRWPSAPAVRLIVALLPLGNCFSTPRPASSRSVMGSGWGHGPERDHESGWGHPFPADVIDLKSWKVTLPIRDGDKVLEIEQPTPATFKHDSFFAVNAGGNGIRFRVFHG